VQVAATIFTLSTLSFGALAPLEVADGALALSATVPVISTL
jgi:hypothetical protein